LAKLSFPDPRRGGAGLVDIPAALLEQLAGLVALADPLEELHERLAPLGVVVVLEVVGLEELELASDLLDVALGEPGDVAIEVEFEVVERDLGGDLADRLHQRAIVLEDVPAAGTHLRGPADGPLGAKPLGIAPATNEVDPALADVLGLGPLLVAGAAALLDLEVSDGRVGQAEAIDRGHARVKADHADPAGREDRRGEGADLIVTRGYATSAAPEA
jgi:hypothetical protein